MADFAITIYYYNPNIDTKLEFMRRAEELGKLKKFINFLEIVEEEYKPEEYDRAVLGLESLGEGSERCYKCYELRMRQTAKYAAENGYDVFTTTLSVSPYKKAGWIHEIGEKLAAEYGVAYLDEDFKKRDGYKRSLELSREMGMYRQDYCGCRYSKIEAKKRKTTI
jgi:Uncharacterized protein conserved in bacteria